MGTSDNFMHSALVIWAGTFKQGGEQLTREELYNGRFLYRILSEIVEVPEHEMLGHQFSEGQLINTSAKAKTWKNLIQGLRVFYQDILHRVIVTRLPEISALLEPDKDETGGYSEMSKLLTLLLGCAILCENSAPFIYSIQTLDLAVQELLVEHIKQVTEQSHIVMSSKVDMVTTVRERQLTDRLLAIVAERNDYAEQVYDSVALRLIKSTAADTSNTVYSYHQHDVFAELKLCRMQLIDLADEIDALTEANRALQTQLDGSSTDLRQQQSANLKLENLVAQYEEELNLRKAVDMDVNGMQLEITRLRSQLDDMAYMKSQIEELEEENSHLMQEGDKIRHLLQLSNTRIEALSDELATSYQDKEHVDKENSTLVRRLMDSESEVARLGREIASFLYQDSEPSLRRMWSTSSLDLQKTGTGHGMSVSEELHDDLQYKIALLEAENEELKVAVREHERRALMDCGVQTDGDMKKKSLARRKLSLGDGEFGDVNVPPPVTSTPCTDDVIYVNTQATITCSPMQSSPPADDEQQQESVAMTTPVEVGTSTKVKKRKHSKRHSSLGQSDLAAERIASLEEERQLLHSQLLTTGDMLTKSGEELKKSKKQKDLLQQTVDSLLRDLTENRLALEHERQLVLEYERRLVAERERHLIVEHDSRLTLENERRLALERESRLAVERAGSRQDATTQTQTVTVQDASTQTVVPDGSLLVLAFGLPHDTNRAGVAPSSAASSLRSDANGTFSRQSSLRGSSRRPASGTISSQSPLKPMQSVRPLSSTEMSAHNTSVYDPQGASYKPTDGPMSYSQLRQLKANRTTPQQPQSCYEFGDIVRYQSSSSSSTVPPSPLRANNGYSTPPTAAPTSQHSPLSPFSTPSTRSSAKTQSTSKSAVADVSSSTLGSNDDLLEEEDDEITEVIEMVTKEIVTVLTTTTTTLNPEKWRQLLERIATLQTFVTRLHDHNARLKAYYAMRLAKLEQRVRTLDAENRKLNKIVLSQDSNSSSGSSSYLKNYQFYTAV